MKIIKNVIVFSQEYPPYNWGGVALFTVNLVNGLRMLGIQVQLMTICKKEGSEKQDNGVVIHRLPASGIYKDELIETDEGMKRHFQFLKKARQLASKLEPPDAVILADGLCFPEAKACAVHFKVPLITMVNQVFADINELWQGKLSSMIKLENSYFHKSDHLVAGSHYMKSRLDLLGYGSKTTQINYGWGFHNWSSQEEPTLQPTDFLFVGRMVPEKGVIILLEAFQKLLQKKPAATLKLIGDGPIKEIAQKYAQEEQMASHVSFVGAMPWTQIALAFQSTKFSLVPSFNEPFGYVALEAIMYGALPLVSNTGGLKEISSCLSYDCTIPGREKEPFIFHPDREKLCEKMSELLDLAPVKRKELVQNARLLASQKYNFITVATQWLQLMENL